MISAWGAFSRTIASHLPRFVEIRHDEGDPHHVVVASFDLAGESFPTRKVEDRDLGVDVGGDEIEPEGAVVKAERGRPLRLRHLIVVELHDVFFAAELVVDAVRTEDPAQKDFPGPSSLPTHDPICDSPPVACGRSAGDLLEKIVWTRGHENVMADRRSSRDQEGMTRRAESAILSVMETGPDQHSDQDPTATARSRISALAADALGDRPAQVVTRLRKLGPNLSLTGVIVTLAVGVILPVILSTSVGIVSIALGERANNLVIGVLVICFAVASIGGAVTATVLLGRKARIARLQADFLANVSHELRTPLSAIRMYAQTLQTGRLQERTGEDRGVPRHHRSRDRVARNDGRPGPHLAQRRQGPARARASGRPGGRRRSRWRSSVSPC